MEVIIERGGGTKRHLVPEEVRRGREWFIETVPEELQKEVGSPCRSIGSTEEFEVSKEVGGWDGGVVEAKSQMRLGGVPVTKKFCCEMGDAALVSRDGSIREECFLQCEEGGGPVQDETGF